MQSIRTLPANDSPFSRLHNEYARILYNAYHEADLPSAREAKEAAIALAESVRRRLPFATAPAFRVGSSRLRGKRGTIHGPGGNWIHIRVEEDIAWKGRGPRTMRREKGAFLCHERVWDNETAEPTRWMPNPRPDCPDCVYLAERIVGDAPR